MNGEEDKDVIEPSAPPENKEQDMAEVVGDRDEAVLQDVAQREEPRVPCLMGG